MKKFTIDRLAAVAVVVLLASPFPGTRAQTVGLRLQGEAEGAQTRKRLVEAQQLLKAGKAPEAASELQRIIDESGDDLVQVQGDQYQPAGRLAQRELAALPAAALENVRDRLEVPARKLLEAGRQARDPQPLQQLLARYFVSRPAEEALLLLGDLAMERGEFTAAEWFWRKLLPPGPGSDLIYPGPTSDPAYIKARLIQTQIYAGQYRLARKAVEDYRRDHPQAEGRLEGRQGRLVSILEQLLEQPPELPDDSTTSPWPTFGGSATRSGQGREPLPFQFPARPTWQASIPRDQSDQDTARPAGLAAARSLAFHPVILGPYAYVADAGRVFSFHLATGASRMAFDVRGTEGLARLDASQLALPVQNDAVYTLSVGGGKLLARFGEVTMPGAEGQKPVSASELFALEPLPHENLPPGAPALKVAWKLGKPWRDGERGAWEGAPLYADGAVYAAFVRADPRGKWIHAVACFADPPGPQPRWVAEVAVLDGNQGTAPRTRHDLLTLAGDHVVYATHGGLTVALQRPTGKPAWAFRNPPASRPPVGAHRDLSPAVYAQNKVFVAPHDAEHVYALDAENGQLLWKSAAVQIEQLLGASGGCLVATISHPQKGIRGFDLETGSDRSPTGWQNHDDPFLASHGRGLVSESEILWPTRTKLYRLRSLDGSIRGQPIPGAAGNLAYGKGVLVAANASGLSGYVAQAVGQDLKQDTPLGQAEYLRWLTDRALAMDRLKPAADRLKQLLIAQESPPEVLAIAAAQLDRLQPGAAKAHPISKDLLQEWVPGPQGWPVRLGAEPVPARDRPAQAAPGEAIPPDQAASALTADVEQTTIATGAWPVLPPAGQREPPGLEPFVPPDCRHLVVTDGKSLIGYRVGAEQPAWRTRLPQVGLVRRGRATTSGRLLAYGSRGVICLDLKNGQMLWDFQASLLDPDLGPPRVSDATVVLMLGPRRLLGLDLETGRVQWCRCADGTTHGRGTVDSAVSFCPQFVVQAGRVMVQLSNGQVWWLSLDRGEVKESWQGGLNPWAVPPEVAGRRVYWPKCASVLEAVDLPDGRVAWRHDSRGETSLSGPLPRSRTIGNTVYLATQRNHGVELAALNATTGEAVWPGGSRLLNVDHLELQNGTGNEDQFLLPIEGRLHSYHPRSGATLWKSDLPGPAAGWQAALGRTAALAFPEHPLVEDDPAEAARRAALRFVKSPDLTALPRLVLGLLEAWTERVWPIVFLDSRSGRPQGRLDIPVRGVPAILHLLGREAAVADFGRITWIKIK